MTRLRNPLHHPRFRRDRGLHDLGAGLYAWVQPQGGWGWSNSGLICDAGESMVVDTLFDVPLTEEMLAAYRRAEPRAAAAIDVVVNTHHNGDHCNGNCCCRGARIIAHQATAAEIPHENPQELAQAVAAAEHLGELGAYLKHAFGGFDLAGVTQTLPTETFLRGMILSVGAKEVRLTHVGPAHTAGDILIHVPADRTIFTGDILFVESHPILWGHPVANWISACDHILSLDVDVVVPGHGPITDKRGVAAMRDYFIALRAAARAAYDAGVGWEEAAAGLDLEAFADWADGERVMLNVASLYREFGAKDVPSEMPVLFAATARLFHQRGG